MLKDDLKCVLIGRDIKIYHDLAKLVRKIDTTSRFKQVDITVAAIKTTLKKINGPSLIFISDEVSFSLELLSDLIWQYSPDSIVVILSKKAETIAVKELFNNTQFTRLKLDVNKRETLSILELLIKSAREKSEFRRCKKLLGVSEKRCQWLVDSSREAVAFISRNMHWYANTAYLSLFGITSIQDLRATTIKDLIITDEHQLFDSFSKSQNQNSQARHSIQLSMKKINGATFRAKVYLIPSVLKGRKCVQLWVRRINSIEDIDETENVDLVDFKKLDKLTLDEKNISTKTISEMDLNPFSGLLNKNNESILIKENASNSDQNINLQPKEIVEDSLNISKPTSYDESSLLKGVIRRKEARIAVKPLSYLKQNEENNKKTNIKHKLLSLNVAAAQKQGVDDLLNNLPEYFNEQRQAVFWDKVKFSRMLQILIQRKTLSMNLLFRINEASVIDEAFVDWLIPGLKRLGAKASHLIFLIPSNINASEHRKTLLFIKKLSKSKCKFALDSFSMSKESLQLLKYSKPEYVRLSLPWVRQIQGNENKEIRLSSAIRRLEANNIRVIAPCGFSKDMRRLFILSGASFCQ